MAKFLQQLLDLDEPMFSVGMDKLEKANGSQGIDTRLIADITHKAHEIMRSLNLNVADTTGGELYHALVASVRTGIAENLLVDTDYILLPFDDNVVSFNLIDVIENSHHELSYAQKISSHGKRCLRGEIVQRYLDDGPADEPVTRSIGSDTGLLPASDQWYNENKHNLKQTGETQAAMKPFILAIGDLVTDAFIALMENEANVVQNDQHIDILEMEFGAKLPYDHVDIVEGVGNSANAAVAFTRLGIRSGLMAYIGNDQAGKDSLAHLADEHVDTTTLSVQEGKKTNYHYVLRYKADRTILIKYEDYDYAWQAPTITPDWVYLSMISASSWQLHLDLLTYLNEHPEVKLAFQPGEFHFEWGTEKLKDIYARTEIIILNREEAAKITGIGTESIAQQAEKLHALGPKTVVITDGPDGSYASDGTKLLSMRNYPDPAPPYERTGAGDAFASTVVALLAQGKTLEDALKWAPINSMSVVQKLGAQAGLINEGEIEEWLKKAPDDYSPKEVMA